MHSNKLLRNHYFFTLSNLEWPAHGVLKKILHSLRCCFDDHWADNNFVVLNIDMTNAFNLVSRQAECAQHFPELLAWASWCYGQHPILWHSLGSLTSQTGVQQGDPLGPFMFALVLQKMVTTIHTDEACAGLLQNAWYLDDGSMAGESSSVLRALTIIQAQGPSLGFFVNLKKCELFSVSDLSSFPPSIQTSNQPNMEILGAPNGDAEFCRQFFASKHQAALALLSTINDLGCIDPQVALALLRLCSSFCKLAHIARTTPSHLILSSMEKFDIDVHRSFAECTGCDVPDSAWRQAQLSWRRGGFGLRSLALHSPAAYIASLCGSGSVIPTPHLENAITHNTCVLLSDSLSISGLVGHTPTQKKLSDAIEEMQFNSLLNSCSLADKARLLSVSSPHASAWISVVPSSSLGLHLDPNEFQTAVKWWLGVNHPSFSSDGNPMVCPLCPNCALDPLGYHCVTCKSGGDVPTRHNTLRNAVHSTFERAGLSAHLEVGCGWGKDNARTRPADILVTNWDCGTSAAFDITVTSPLNSLNMLEAGMYQGVSAKSAEHRKHTENDPKCVALAWRCIPLAVESYGAWGPEASKAFSQVATRLAIRGNTPKAKIVAELYGRLSLLLVRANARSILCRSYPQTPQQENELTT